jgi:small multidrug resistance pump
MAVYYTSLAAAILLGVGGQIALRSAVDAASGIARQFLHPMTIIGLMLYILAAVCYIVALKKIPVSIAFPSASASYAIVAIVAHLLWNEPLGRPQIAGLVLIGAGVVFLNQR